MKSQLWFTDNDHPDGGSEEFNKDCADPIWNLSDASLHSGHDALFTYSIEDIDVFSDRLRIPWEWPKDQPFSSCMTYIRFQWNLNTQIVTLAPAMVDKCHTTIYE